MSAKPALYQPDSKVLFLSIYSLHKKKGGDVLRNLCNDVPKVAGSSGN